MTSFTRALAFLLIGLTTQSLMAAITIDASSRGCYDETTYQFGCGESGTSHANHFAGRTAPNANVTRNFFYFDLSSVNSPVQSARLAIDIDDYFYSHPGGGTYGYRSNDPTETYGLFDYLGDSLTLIQGAGGAAAYNDLGEGVLFGTLELEKADEGTQVFLTLNSAGLAAINGALGGSITFGGALLTLSADTTHAEGVFGNSLNTNIRSQLILTAVPEPSCVTLAGFALLAFTSMSRGAPSGSASRGLRQWKPNPSATRR